MCSRRPKAKTLARGTVDQRSQQAERIGTKVKAHFGRSYVQAKVQQVAVGILRRSRANENSVQLEQHDWSHGILATAIWSNACRQAEAEAEGHETFHGLPNPNPPNPPNPPAAPVQAYILNMESFFRSFVHKVHAHALARPGDVCDETSVRSLLVIIEDKSVSSDVAFAAIDALVSGANWNPSSFLSCGGVAAMIGYLTDRTMPAKEEMPIRARIINLLTHAPQGELQEAIINGGGTPVVRSLFDCYISMENPVISFELVCLLSTNDSLLLGMSQSNLLAPLMQLLTNSTLDDADATVYAVRALYYLILSANDVACFWRFGGAFLITSLARHRAMKKTGSSHVTRLLARIASRQSDGVTVGRREIVDVIANKNVGYAILYELAEAQSFTDFLYLQPYTTMSKFLHSASVVHKFVNIVVQHISTQFITHEHLQQVFQILYEVEDVAFTDACFLFRALEDDPDNGIHAAYLMLRRADTIRIGQHMSELLAFFFGKIVSCAHTTVTEKTRCDFDEMLSIHLGILWDLPAAITSPFQVYGGVATFVHTATLVLGGVPPIPGTRAGDLIINRLSLDIRALMHGSPTQTTIAYLRDLDQKYRLECLVDVPIAHTVDNVAFVPQCPITLGSMHFPVVASDGHTYELTSLIQMARCSDTLRSPLTREDLESFVIFNRGAAECQPLAAAPTSTPPASPTVHIY